MHYGVRANTVKCVKCPSFDVQSVKQFSICFLDIFHAACSFPRAFFSLVSVPILPLSSTACACASASVSPQLDSRQAGNIHANLSIPWRSILEPVEAERGGDRREKVHGGVQMYEREERNQIYLLVLFHCGLLLRSFHRGDFLFFILPNIPDAPH